MKKKGFTIIELLIVVAIISILATVVTVSLYSSAQRKSAIVSYKSSMESLRTALEGCFISGYTVFNGSEGDAVCGGVELYPDITPKCDGDPSFVVSGGELNWSMTTVDGGTYWDCRGCRLICNTEGCQEALGTDCY